MVLLLFWLFITSLLFSSRVILRLIPSRYKPRSNCPAPRGILRERKKKTFKGPITVCYRDIWLDQWYETLDGPVVRDTRWTSGKRH